MSYQATEFVLRHSKSKGSARQVLTAIAHEIHSSQDSKVIEHATLAKLANVSTRQIIRIIAHLEKLGELSVRRGLGRYSGNRYSVGHTQKELFMGDTQGKSGVTSGDFRGDTDVTQIRGNQRKEEARPNPATNVEETLRQIRERREAKHESSDSRRNRNNREVADAILRSVQKGDDAKPVRGVPGLPVRSDRTGT